jgi:hypothetical protein
LQTSIASDSLNSLYSCFSFSTKLHRHSNYTLKTCCSVSPLAPHHQVLQFLVKPVSPLIPWMNSCFSLAPIAPSF